MAELIDRAVILRKNCHAPAKGNCNKCDWNGDSHCSCEIFGVQLANALTVDAVEVETLKAWLYEMAMNNTNNYLGDACEVIISRLDGLRVFARERRTDADN